jgi:hypothetical protein
MAENDLRGSKRHKFGRTVLADATTYGQNYQQHLLEQYKLYVEMADNISARRAQTNQFYVSVLSALLAVVALVAKIYGAGPSPHPDLVNIAFLAITILGLVLCLIWYLNLMSYRQLNSGKFKVIHEMEAQLPYKCYDREWELLGRGTDWYKYLSLTTIERYVPAMMAIPFALVFVYVLLKMLAS